jgi:tetratricopeptide (TPR) repeat protein
MNPPISSTFDQDVLLIFVGFSSDGDAGANAIVSLEPDLQGELDKLKAVKKAIPFNHVKVWKWNNDAHAAIGGQAVVVTPELERANIAVFVFKERIGRVTWLELDFARNRNPPIPVLVFFPSKPPTDDRMMEDDVAEQWLDLLKKKKELIAGWTDADSKAVIPLPTYSDVGRLRNVARERLTSTLVQLLRKNSRRLKSWRPAVVHPLQPAPNFAGREAILKNLSSWLITPNDPNHVVALVAAGGTGKTALVERVLSLLTNHSASGVFVWSFYENPQTEAFLRSACVYFLRKVQKQTGGLLERLQQGFRADNLPHLLVLDGLELVQATGTTGRIRGTLEDPLMRRLLRWLAVGQGTKAKALITSRFSLPDLEDWKDHGFLSLELDDLDPIAARYILRKRGVKGDDTALDTLTESVHRHALTVDVLGLYLHRFGDDDPKNAVKFNLKSFSNQQKAERLSKVLTSYAEKLPNEERDLLARLSLFPHGVSIEYLKFIVSAGKETAGTLVLCDQAKLLDMLESLRELGLVFLIKRWDGVTYTAHPFLRDFFRTLLDTTKPEQVHEAVRRNIASSLEERPSKNPTDPADLNRYERLIEVTRMAGESKKAFDLYWFGLGGYKHLGKVLGENARGLRILAAFSKNGSPDPNHLELPRSEHAPLITDWGLFAEQLGDLNLAREAFNFQIQIRQMNDRDYKNLSVAHQNACEVELIANRLPAACEGAKQALRYAELADNNNGQVYAHAYLAMASYGMGLFKETRYHFGEATKIENVPMLFSRRGLFEAEFKLAIGNQAGAHIQTGANQKICSQNSWIDDVARCETLAGRCALPDGPQKAHLHLTAAREYASCTGDVEVTLRCYHLAAEIFRHEGNLPLAISEALDGVQLADSCGFGRWSLDIRIELARIYLANNEPAKAIEPAELVLKRSQDPECQYAWGIADSLYLLGIANALLGDKSKAIDYLERAIEKRKPLEHPGLKDTEEELRKLKEE